MAEKQQQQKKSGGSYKPQSATTIGRNKRLKAERHAKRMADQLAVPKLPRGTARNLRRKPLQIAYAKAHPVPVNLDNLLPQ